MKEKKVPSKSILLGDEYVPYQVRISTRALRWRLSVTVDGVEIVVPEGRRVHPEKLLREYADWIREKRKKLQKRQLRLNKKALPDDRILLQGRQIRLEFRAAGILEKQSVQYFPERITVVSGRSSPSVLLKKWLTKQAETAIVRQVGLRAPQMGVKPASITIRNQRTRWGSCSTRGTLSFNWRLIMAPPEVLDYVVVHELAHMKQKNHSKAFWTLVEKYCAQYANYRLWLKQNQAALWPDLFE